MDSSKTIKRFSAGALVYLIFINVFFTEAQVTFSRDWNAGKRSNIPDCTAAIKSAATICQMLMNELRTIATCELHPISAPRMTDDIVTQQEDLFGPQHNG